MPNSLPRYSSYRNHFFLRLVVVATKEGHASGMPYLNNLAYFSRVDLLYILKMSTVQTGNALVGGPKKTNWCHNQNYNIK